MTSLANKLTGANARTAVIAAAGLVVIGLLIAGLYWLSQPNQIALTNKGDEKSTADIIALLTQWDEPFTIDENTGQILVEESRAPALRAKLVNEGSLGQSPLGFDLFAQGDYGLSDFAQRVNYQRALEGELAKTIRTMAEVRGVRVHISLAKGSMFEDRKEIAKASIFLQMKPGKTLSDQQTLGIRRLVAAAVPGLKDENVAIVDEFGNALTADDTVSLSKNQWTWTQRYEAEYEQKASDLISALISDVDFHVSVRVKANFDKVRSVKEQIIPANASGAGYLNKKRESFANGNNANSVNTTGTQNTSQQETEYLYGKEQSEIERAVGQIERVSVGVVFAKELPESIKTELSKVLQTGLGMQDSRGDQLTVAAMSLQRAMEKQDQQIPTVERQDAENQISPSTESRTAFSAVHIVAIALLVLVLGLLMGRLTAPRNRITTTVLSEQQKQELIAEAKQWLKQVD